MRQNILIVMLISSKFLFGQFGGDYSLSFDNNYNIKHLFIDTISNKNNIWEIGAPEKTIFDSSYSLPNAICTKLSGYYPTNDTSTFIITNTADNGLVDHRLAYFSGYYKIDSDTLKDFGKIEFSPDNGITWINLISDTVYLKKNCYEWSTDGFPGKPTFTGHSDHWKAFALSFKGFANEFKIDYIDPVKFKFTFISDSIDNKREGWMLDNFFFTDFYESIKKLGFNYFDSEVYPNPSKEQITIEFNNEYQQECIISILNIEGKAIETFHNNNARYFSVNISNYDKGIYFYQIWQEQDKKITTGKFIKQ